MGANVTHNKTRRWRWLLWLPLLFAIGSMQQVLWLRFIDPPVSMGMLWRSVGAVASGQQDYHLRHQWRDLSQISSCLPISMVAAEDQRFPMHHGFDLHAIASARAHNAEGGRLHGASTISQQVAKNLFLWPSRSWVRKGLEAWYTLLIELVWPKQRILEVYVNIVELGDGVYGAQAAAQTFWGRDASALSSQQCARLAAVLPSPRRYNARQPGPYVQRRANWIQRQVRQLGGPAWLEKK